jgi:hypothetical protein
VPASGWLIDAVGADDEEEEGGGVEVGGCGDCGREPAKESGSRLEAFLGLTTSMSGRGGTTSSRKSRLSPCATVLAAHK